jgi:hypothetical protein
MYVAPWLRRAASAEEQIAIATDQSDRKGTVLTKPQEVDGAIR